MMLVRRNPETGSLVRRSRDAFTLIEVLVVVAILVILASVATVGMMRYLETAKENNAKLNAQNIQKAIKAYKLSHEEWPSDLTQLCGTDGGASFLEGGVQALRDPWGGTFTFEIVQDQSGDEVPYVYCMNPKTGRRYGWPKDVNQ
jgi:general secretion pathway protein G